ncbi:MAG: YXWGXW repeat-containing protein [Terriglobus sp.]
MNVPTAVRASLTTVATTLALTAASLMAAPALHAQMGISVNVGFARTAPPPLPEVVQPEAPGDGYIWTPGYWAWDDQVQDYYWVEGEWVMAPETGMLWTPGYWNYDNGGYVWNAGYWGPEVGFYGGVNYGFGYFGTGYDGGYWNGNRFFYNTAVNHVNLRFVHNTFVRNVDFHDRGPRVAFHGGPGGLRMQPNADQQRAMQERRFAPMMTQQRGGYDRNPNRDFTRGGNFSANTQANGFRGGDQGFRGNDGFHGGNDNRGNDGFRGGNDNRGGNSFNGNTQRPGNGFTPGDGQNRPAPPNRPRMDFPAMRGQVNTPQPPQRSFDQPRQQQNDFRGNDAFRGGNDNRGGNMQGMLQGGNRFQGGGEQRQNFAPQGNVPQPQGNRGGGQPSGMRGFGR